MSDVLVDAAPTTGAIPVYAIDADALAARLADLGEAVASWAGASGFKAQAGEILLVPGASGIASVLFGLGKADKGEPHLLATGKLPFNLPRGTYALADYPGDLDLATLGFALGAYRFDRYRSATREPARLVVPDGVDGDAIRRIAAGVRLARDLINTPANDLGTAELAEAARRLADRYGAACAEVTGDELAAGFPLIHAVGAASTRAPRLVDITWGAADAPKVTLVGKGVVFDTGGLDIKPSSGMALMKKDMGGAANALALASMIMDAGLPVRLRVLLPIVENAISGASFRPGDVFRSRKGITVEIGNTDAEGRLILADALALADEEAPDLLVDLATLTGAARAALGPDLPPFYTDDDAFAGELARHCMAVADPVWRLPLWRGYLPMLESKVADINHISGGPFAGSITAALFLSRFVENARTWAHFDIFAWNPKAAPGRPEGGEAQAVRGLFALLSERYGKR